MTWDQLLRLQQEHVFDPAPRVVDLDVYHVLARQEHAVTGRLGAPRWLLQAELAAELRTAADAAEHAQSGVTILDEAAELLARIQRNGLLPILVIDDSDSWLNVAGVDRTPLSPHSLDA